jgi:hypothetical protein
MKVRFLTAALCCCWIWVVSILSLSWKAGSRIRIWSSAIVPSQPERTSACSKTSKRVLYHLNRNVKLELTGAYRTVIWSTSDDSWSNGDTYAVANRSLVIGFGALFPVSF